MNPNNMLYGRPAKILAVVLVLPLLVLGSCTADFGAINNDPNKMTPEDLERDYNWGSFLTTMQRYIFPEDENDYQRAYNLSGDIYSGYLGATNTWNGGNNGTTYGLMSDWYDRAFTSVYGDILPAWKKLTDNMESGTVITAVADIVKVTAVHRIADMYGPLPYTSFGVVQSRPPYDPLDEIYEAFFSELDDAIAVLTSYIQNNGTSSRPIAKFDIVYGSDLVKWVKYANSLKLRLAMRVRYADPQLAAVHISRALDPSGYGVLESVSDIAQIANDNPLGVQIKNALNPIWYNWDDCRMGANMASFLTGYNDPRGDIWFTRVSNSFNGVRTGINMTDSNVSNYRSRCSRPTVGLTDPMVWMTAAEVYFLRAEAAVFNLSSESAEDMYNNGIRASFEQYGLLSQSAAYLANSTSVPAAYTDVVSSGNSIPSGNANLSTVTIKWSDTDTNERKLERIITQKWLAMYPNGQEAWAEFRRTGYPKVFPVMVNNSNGAIDTQLQIRRLPFPTSEYTSNREQVLRAVELLGGQDNGGTRLWWDKK
ncbi:MAG: SusD/RagB family nutrient-binding outer membrane lipoprotein [Rikenellaceae bacterium]|nr:SusD/RagB family nutrient-binding outer membrane lipoprotein [Rikenellaceae bacterium]